jgi:hypothetical protein
MAPAWELVESNDLVGSVLVSRCCEKLVAEARGQFGNPEKRERPPLEAVTRRLVKPQQIEKTYVCALALQLLAGTSCVYKCSINPLPI